MTYTYYADGGRQSMSTPAGTFNYYEDGAGRASQLTNPFGQSFQWSYKDNNWLAVQGLVSNSTNRFATFYTCLRHEVA